MRVPQSSDAELARSALTKASWRILPLIVLAYVCALMDRVNIGFAAIQMHVDLGFSATIYGLGGGLFFLSYALFEVPSNILLARFGARRWIARIMITWGFFEDTATTEIDTLSLHDALPISSAAEAG